MISEIATASRCLVFLKLGMLSTLKLHVIEGEEGRTTGFLYSS